jgi:dienelactone hydrolase
LAQHGITALVLKYRTIRSASDPMQMPEVHMQEMEIIMTRAKSGAPAEIPHFAGEQHAVDDGTRAMRMVRQRAAEWGIDPKRIGFIGFSAGAFLAVDLAIGDKVSRPDFVALLYGGLRTPVPADAPPAFIAAAADDEYQPNDAMQLYTAWRLAWQPNYMSTSAAATASISGRKARPVTIGLTNCSSGCNRAVSLASRRSTAGSSHLDKANRGGPFPKQMRSRS